MSPGELQESKDIATAHRRDLSQEAERANWPSEDMVTSETKSLWPWRMRLA